MRRHVIPAAGIAIVIGLLSPQAAAAQTSPPPAPAAAQSQAKLLPLSYMLGSQPAAGVEAAARQQAAPVIDASAKFRATQKAALKWEVGYLVLSAVDAVQTIDCVHRNACEEANPIFGKHPSAARVILTKAGVGLAHFLVFRELNKRNPKSALRAAQFSAGLQGTFVVLNVTGVL